MAECTQDSIAGLKVNQGWITIIFRSFIAICSLTGAIMVGAFWLNSDKHNDLRYVKIEDSKTEQIHQLQIQLREKELLDYKLSILQSTLANIQKTLENHK